jgi:hypothetical protein
MAQHRRGSNWPARVNNIVADDESFHQKVSTEGEHSRLLENKSNNINNRKHPTTSTGSLKCSLHVAHIREVIIAILILIVIRMKLDSIFGKISSSCNINQLNSTILDNGAVGNESHWNHISIATTTTTTNINPNTNPTKFNTDLTATVTTDDVIETVDVVFHNLQYRRACTSVGLHSILCMIIRYPFPVAVQVNDTSIRYPKPVEEQFYKLKKGAVYVVNQHDWFSCNSQDMIVHDDAVIEQCLTKKATEMTEKSDDKQVPVITLWTRERRDTKTKLFHYTGHEEGIQRIYEFFGYDHQVIVTGASPSPAITKELQWMFGWTCTDTYVNKKPNYNCDNPIQQSSSSSKKSFQNVWPDYDLPYTSLQEGHINLGVFDYRTLGRNGQHYMTNITALDAFEPIHRADGWEQLRNFSLIVEYPIAHVQSQDMIQQNVLHTTIQSLQKELPSRYMEFTSDIGRKVLATRGYSLQHFIVFDGLPQFFPTETSGFTKHIFSAQPESELKNIAFSYPGWKPDYGTSCVGPLPQNSLLREINDMSRKSFQEQGHDMRWYGRTWEFANLFWWQMKMCKYCGMVFLIFYY